MVPGASRVLSLALAALALTCAGCGVIFDKEYEYEEELALDVDGSATLDVHASVPALVALHGAPLSLDGAEPDRAALRAMFAGPGVQVDSVRFSRRDGRRFVHVSLDVADVRALDRVAPFTWSTYAFERSGDVLEFRQRVGRPSGTRRDVAAWSGDELVAFRIHVPSEVLFENATTNVQRGNILAWEQPLAERLAGTPVDLHVRMEPDSILHATLLLFASTVAAAALTFGAVIWWVVRKGRRAQDAPGNPGAPLVR